MSHTDPDSAEVSRSGRATPRLGDLERAVMDVLWVDHEEPLTVRAVHEALSTRRDIAYTTVMTVLDRLARKGVVDQARKGRAYTYRAHRTRAEMTAGLMREALDDVSSGDRGHALVAFVGEASADDLEALREALAALER